MTGPEQKRNPEISGKRNVILSVGSNCGDRYAQVSSGVVWLSSILDGSRSSSIYSTRDCYGGKREYMNAVVSGKTGYEIEALERECKKYELNQGRTRDARINGDVPIDIDIVVYDNEIVRKKDYGQEFFRIGMRQITLQSQHSHCAPEIQLHKRT